MSIRLREFGFLYIGFLSKGRDSDALSSKKDSCFVFFNLRNVKGWNTRAWFIPLSCFPLLQRTDVGVMLGHSSTKHLP